MTALVVEPAVQDRVLAASTLSAAGFHVTVADTFAAAKERMAALPPAVLITNVCLAEYNGLHLVIRGQSATPNLAAVVTCSYDDVVLRTEAERLGAAFVVTPVPGRELLAAVMRLLFRGARETAPLRPPYERRVAERRARRAGYAGPERRRIERRRPVTELLQSLRSM